MKNENSRKSIIQNCILILIIKHLQINYLQVYIYIYTIISHLRLHCQHFFLSFNFRKTLTTLLRIIIIGDYHIFLRYFLPRFFTSFSLVALSCLYVHRVEIKKVSKSFFNDEKLHPTEQFNLVYRRFIRLKQRAVRIILFVNRNFIHLKQTRML